MIILFCTYGSISSFVILVAEIVNFGDFFSKFMGWVFWKFGLFMIGIFMLVVKVACFVNW
ncbi:hypothetical protein ACQWHL_24885, partial [Salmonella enterica subsp. enterica serovar Infantis]